MTFQSDELRRLRDYARERWQIENHVLPYELAEETLHLDVRASALAYFQRHGITWWTSRWDSRGKEMDARPTGHLNSSQVACVNHLEPARVDADVARQVLAAVDPALAPVALDDGFVEYEWIGKHNYLGERGARTRGANVTSLDAMMCGEANGRRTLIVIEWKYLESYGAESVATSRSGADRVEVYRALLDRRDCPIVAGEHARLFYEPYYQLMRQTLLAWQMVEYAEFDATDWIHIHVIPELNVTLRGRGKSAPELTGTSMAAAWQSTLKEPRRYRLVSPTELLDHVHKPRWTAWRSWLHQRYLT